tara:strand:+ start:2989 stop:3240 length:252 start_codon:yes stop_codon:yes gene_type:complete
MKLSDGIITCPMSGECEIDVEKIKRCFGKSFISKHYNVTHDSNHYRLVNKRLGLKITIGEQDALELIDLLDLVEVPCPEGPIN